VICFSLEMPEVSAALKNEGVQLVLGPSATVDEDGVARVLRASSARAVELVAAVLVAPLSGAQEDWKNLGSAALYLPAQEGIDHRPQESVRRKDGIAHDDFVIPWKALIDLRRQPERKPETRPFLARTFSSAWSERVKEPDYLNQRPSAICRRPQARVQEIHVRPITPLQQTDHSNDGCPTSTAFPA
jgi:hypothetical protein